MTILIQNIWTWWFSHAVLALIVGRVLTSSESSTTAEISTIRGDLKMPSIWKLASADRRYSLALEVTDNGALNGALIYDGTRYSVAGGWDASFSLPGRNFSAFALSGFTEQVTEGAPNFVASTGIMTGPGNAPTQIDIQMDVSSSSDGSFHQYKGVLLPF